MDDRFGIEYLGNGWYAVHTDHHTLYTNEAGLSMFKKRVQEQSERLGELFEGMIEEARGEQGVEIQKKRDDKNHDEDENEIPQ